MRKYLLIALVSLGSAGAAHATILFNGVGSASGITSVLETVGGTNISSLPIISITTSDGGTIASITATITSDYTGATGGSPVVDYTYSWVTNTPGFGAIPNGQVSSGPDGPIVVGSLTGLSLTSATLQFALSTIYDELSTGAVAGASGTMIITATENPLVGGVPEPATLGLVGGALLGLGALSRRKKRS